VNESTDLAERFEENRTHLRAVAYRMLGSTSEADDALQEAWLKAARADRSAVENLRAWMTTIVARVCLDTLRSRKAHATEPLGPGVDAASARSADTDIALEDALGPALQIVLDTLTPAERVAFVLHDLFELPFEAIAPNIDRSYAATRQLASRARRRVSASRGTASSESGANRELVSAFLAASRAGDLAGLVSLLSPGAVLRADELALRTAAERANSGAPSLAAELRGATLVAEAFKGRARAAKMALLNGEPGAVWVMGGEVKAAFVFALEGGAIGEVDVIMEPADLAELEVEILDRST
jgi:RNA polymerase sigma factor (sigma-70 family)